MPLLDPDAFARLARTYDRVPLALERLADLETPLTALAKLRRARGAAGGSFLLESVEGGAHWGRYSFLGTSPRLFLQSHAGAATLRDSAGTLLATGSDWREFARDETVRRNAYCDPSLPPFAGGWVGWIGYDAAQEFEPAVRLDPHRPGHVAAARYRSDWPTVSLALHDEVLLFDHVRQRLSLVVWADLREFPDPREAYHEARERLERLDADLTGPHGLPPLEWPDPLPTPEELEVAVEPTRPDYEAAVERAQEAIRAGDLIQVVLARRFETVCRGSSLDLYRILRSLNPSPYLYFVDHGERHVVGASPEVLVRKQGTRLTVRPIAGTRPRGRDAEEDAALERELRADPKECAEHAMLVDLGRNDVGRLARAGSVRVLDFAHVERYSHVLHLVTQVEGELEGVPDALDVLGTCFPAGTVSGAPKVRAMQWIAAEEPFARGPYAGAVGYLAFSGDLDVAIALRTIFRQGEVAWIGAGAGIVADSIPHAEALETESKARGPLTALAILGRQSGLRGEEERDAAGPR